jgi:hypothetical protein
MENDAERGKRQGTQVVEVNTQDAKKVLKTAERAAGSGDVIFRGYNWHSFWQGVLIILKNEVMEWNVSHKYSILSLQKGGGGSEDSMCQQSRNNCSVFNC